MANVKIYDFIIESALQSTYAQENEQVLKWMNNDMDTLIEYYKAVYSQEQRIQLMKARTDNSDADSVKEYQQFVMKLDEARRLKHDAAISGLKDLESCCKQCGYGSCVNVDLDTCHRTDIADAIFDFCAKWVKKSKNK